MQLLAPSFRPACSLALLVALGAGASSCWGQQEGARFAGVRADVTLEDDPVALVEPTVLQPGGTATIRYRNPAWTAADRLQARPRRVFLHYGFNGWNLPIDGDGGGREEIFGNTNHFARSAMQLEATTGDYVQTVSIPSEARALHFVFCWEDCDWGQWDNNEQRDYGWPIVFPYIGPLLTWGQTTASGDPEPHKRITISFAHPSNGAAAREGWVRYGVAGGRTKTVRVPGGTSYVAHLSDLQADTRYTYQVGVGADFSSPVYTFKTAKSPDRQRTARFAVFGDAQDNGETGRFAATVAELRRAHRDLDFLVATGDLPWNDNPGDWWWFFDLARPLLAEHAFMPAIGNHDTPGVDSHPDHASFNGYFPLPYSSGGGYYDFRFGPARFLALDSEKLIDFAEPDGLQRQWLAGKLRARPTKWTFAYWHVPAFNAGVRHASQQFDFRPVTRLFNGKVDWQLSGHEHMYQRYKPMRFDGQRITAASTYGEDGVGYLLVPPAGANAETALVAARGDGETLRERLAFPSGDTAPSFNGFVRVDATRDGLRLRTFGRAREQSGDAEPAFDLVDEVEYEK